MSDLPTDLTSRPLALIGLTGLDISSPTIHRYIWEAFTNNRRTDGPPVQFKLLSDNHEFPVVKPKRNSYDRYIPKGILKRNWMNKYLKEVPAVVVVFYNLDWNDPAWMEKKIECASRVQSLRSRLEGRNTKIAVVLIQSSATAPPGSEDVVATERATALCAACELPAKSLYVLPQGDHLLGYTFRLENAFYELAQNFYYHEYRRLVKILKDPQNKTTYHYLTVRHQFKMGFFNEMKQDLQTAYKHYQLAYNNLLEIRAVDTHVMEIKTVAGFINYKLCRLMFMLNLPKDAIAHFRSHVEKFKLRSGQKELMFEHHAWISSQFSTFAELFDEAIRDGLPAVQTQHPGYYFQNAVLYANLRKTSSTELCSNVTSYPDPDPLAGEEKLEFYGQRPWRAGKLSAEPDMAKEAIAIQALQYREKTTVNHSAIIISLLGNAISQFKIYRCPRMRRLLVVKMAEEYYNAKDYGKVLTLLMHMLWEYRVEQWPVLLTDILKNALRAAYLSTSVQDYISLVLEGLRPSTTFPQEHRSVMYNNLINILQKIPPKLELGLPDDAAELARQKWKMELSRPEPIVFTVEDNNIASFIEVKARFSQAKYTINDTVMIEIFVRNSYSEPIEFSKLLVNVSNPGLSSEFTIADEDLKLQGRETKKFHCKFHAPRQSNGGEISINSISLFLGKESCCCVILKYSAVGGESNFNDRFYPEIHQLRIDEFEVIRPLVTAEIKEDKNTVELEVKSKEPALLGEWFQLPVELKSLEDISNVTLNLSLDASDQSIELSLNADEKQSKVSKAIGKITKDNVHREIVYVRSHKVGSKNISVKVEYSKEEHTKCTKDFPLTLHFAKPFEMTTQFYTTLFESTNKGFVDEPLIVMPHLTCTSPWPINIIDATIELSDLMRMDKNEKQKSSLSNSVLSEGESGTDIYCIVPKSGSEQPTSTGVYVITWKRANDDSAMVTSSSVTLSPLRVDDALVGLEAKLPAHGWVRTPLCACYFIRNHSNYLITLRVTMEPSDAFMFAGQTQVDICILPKNEKKIEWILRPLVAGFVALPTLSLSVPPDEEQKLNKIKLMEVLEQSLPTHIYIMPKSQSADS